MTPGDPLFFAAPAQFRAWLQEHHDQRSEQWVGYYKVGSGVSSMTWPESVDEALCFGWIDGIRKSIDDRRYRIRFTPRRPGSHWSARNLARMDELLAAERVTEAGLAAYRNRNRANEKKASYEQADVKLPPEYEAELCAEPAAWRYLQAARPSYRKQVTWWVVSAKREETRRRRLAVLVESCARGEPIPAMRWAAVKGPRPPRRATPGKT